ncbi:MAG: TraX family protein [Candidatus Falkowbacteria bacterium]
MLKRKGGALKFSGNTNTDFLKIVAAITMLVDHVGRVFFQNILLFDIIGRLSFPLFAYCLALGAGYTKNFKKYFLRLLAFAIISQPIYSLLFNRPLTQLNVIFTLLFGLIAIYALREKKYFLFAATLIGSYFLAADYGLDGVLLILIFYIFKDKLNILLAVSFAWLVLYFVPLAKPDFYLGNVGLSVAGFAVFSLIFIALKTNFKIKLNKYFFYIFYPAHLALLYLIRLFI